jgi:hypothetical protein
MSGWRPNVNRLVGSQPLPSEYQYSGFGMADILELQLRPGRWGSDETALVWEVFMLRRGVGQLLTKESRPGVGPRTARTWL